MSDLPPPLHVLLIEDEPRLRDALMRTLCSMDFSVEGVGSAEAALRLFNQEKNIPQKIDVVLLDLNLPGMSGIEFLKQLRQKCLTLQVIILTGHGDLCTAQQAMRLDVVDFLTKPFTLRELESAFARAQARLRPPDEKPRLASGEEIAWEDDFPSSHVILPQTKTKELDLPLSEIEKQHILQMLASCHGNRRMTAEKLGISLRLLYYRLKTYETE